MRLLYSFLVATAIVVSPYNCMAASGFEKLFGYDENSQVSLTDLPHWLSVIARHLTGDNPENEDSLKAGGRDTLLKWREFLDGISKLPPRKQLAAVNDYANDRKYILDITNYGMEDYWAIVREFLYNNGDCEDYAITKFFSLRLLGFKSSDLRLVILQDLNLSTPHAVLAVLLDKEILILDNQTREVISHDQIVHYIPLYSLNEKKWWLHLPPL